MTIDKKKLKSLGIKKLQSYFIDEENKKSIKTKFDNISGKTGRYFVPDTLFQKRTARKNRVLIPYDHIINNDFSFSMLEKFEGGVVVEFTNTIFFDELKKSESEQKEIFKLLKDRLGSDENVSAIINIRSTGSSSSESQREAQIKLDQYLIDNQLDLKSILIKRKNNIKYEGTGNDKWEGFIYYNIRGGQHDVKDSHVEAGIPKDQVQLFNPSVEYANEEVSLDITLVLIYFAFFSVSEKNRDAEWFDLVYNFEEYFKTKFYFSSSLYEYVSNHICLNLEKDILMDPIQCEKISIEDFLKKDREDDSLDITHEISVKKAIYRYDSTNDTISTPAYPTNLFWSKHLSNMMQQDFSLTEYFERQRSIIKKWDKYNQL